MSDKKKKRKIRRRWMFFILVILMLGAVLFSRMNRETDPREEVAINNIQQVEIQTTDQETAEVALIRSDKEFAYQISDEEVREMVRQAVELAGGLESIVSDGDFVVLKPNMIAAKHVAGGLGGMFDGDSYTEENILDPRANGIATDFRIAQAVAELVRELNPNGQIYIMETSGWGNTKQNMEILGYTAENFPMVDMIVDFDDLATDASKYNDELVAFDLGDKKLYEDDGSLAHTNGLLFMDKLYYSADVVIDLPVLKNHSNAGFTGAVKNVAIGVAPVRIYGSESNMLDLNRMSINHGWEPLNKWIHDFYLVKPVDFVVTDGLQGSGYGPVAMGASSLEEAQQNMRLVMASNDPLAIDTIHAYLVGTDPMLVDYMVYLAEENIGVTDPAKITILGNAVVGDIKQKFGLPGFPMSIMAAGPIGAQYDDFDAPQVSVENVQFDAEMLSGNLTSNEEIIKIDVYINDEFNGVINQSGTDFSFEYEIEGIDNISNIVLRAYDQYLNSTDLVIE